MFGGCRCGAVRFVVHGQPKSVVNCHCNLCRSLNGSAYSTYVAVAEDELELTKGEPRTFAISEDVSKQFCDSCGSPLYNTNSVYRGLAILHLGALDNPRAWTPQANIYCESQLDWVEKLDQQKSLVQGFG